MITEENKSRFSAMSTFIETNLETLNQYIDLKNEIINENKETGYLFNPLSLFKIGETTHSLIIASLLDKNSNHGQGDLFLKSFLELFEIDYDVNDDWIVTAEKGRVDILLRTINRNSVVIIENKSNYATDQSNQIYRYWHQEMFSYHKDNPQILDKKNKFRIIYLTPSYDKILKDDSLKRPSYLHDNNNLPELLDKDKIDIASLDDQICKIIQSCIPKIHTNNLRLKIFLEQYCEYIKNENEMNQELVKKGSEELFQKVYKWNSFVELSNIKDAIINHWFSLLKENLIEHYSHNKINNWSLHHQDNDFQFYPSDSRKDSPASLWLEFKEWGIIFSLYTSKNVDKCWEKIENSDLTSLFSNKIKSPGNGYLFWGKIDENLTYEQLAWKAGNKTEELQKIITDKIELITSDSKITTLLKELNTL